VSDTQEKETRTDSERGHFQQNDLERYLLDG